MTMQTTKTPDSSAGRKSSGKSLYNVADYGAEGIARPAQELELNNLSYKWIRYPPGTRATVYHPEPGAALDSIGIQKAIDAAHAAGGGTVVVPSGDYLVAPLKLRSRVRLHLESGARLWASPALEDYVNYRGLADGALTFLDPTRPAEGALHGWPGRPPKPGDPLNLIFAMDAEDVAITGAGEIHGQSPAWIIPWMNEMPESWTSLSTRRPGNALILFSNCRHALIEGVRIFDSPSWCLVFSRCRHVRATGVFIRHFDAMNADGIDLVDTSNAVISDCDIHVTDDAICLKTDMADPSSPGVRNVAVSNCVIRTWCNAVKIGTETSGTFENVTFSNIVVHNPDDDLKGAEAGINVCCCDGGVVRNVSFNGFVMHNAECAFYLVTTPRKKFQQSYREPVAGQMERVSISDVTADGVRYTSFVVGSPGHPIRDVSIRNVSVRKTHEFRPGPFLQTVPACAEQYPTPFMFGSPTGGSRDRGDGLSASGLYLRDAERVVVRDFRLDCAEPDGRPTVAHESCSGVEVK